MFGSKKKIAQLTKLNQAQSREIESLKSDVSTLEEEVHRLQAKYEPNKVAERVPSRSASQHLGNMARPKTVPRPPKVKHISSESSRARDCDEFSPTDLDNDND